MESGCSGEAAGRCEGEGLPTRDRPQLPRSGQR
ncbi:rCG38364 [Rattus norvegicus]|uniref:RCG38364 n=1 Tax=Rattus norvegicus TaxID=10116 RepID=A6KTQ5_RAT|nr:rCG38364 [Rattus norvegicus]